MKNSSNQKTLITRDFLAIERTKLANERTFLAYFRTSIALLASGIAIYKIEFFREIEAIGMMLILAAPVIFLVGLIRLLYVRKKIRQYYNP